MNTAYYNQKEILSPEKGYIALLHESKKGYVVYAAIDGQPDEDREIGWISHSVEDEAFYDLHNQKLRNINLPNDLYNLLQLCCRGCFDTKSN